jgi:hypothetical protein
MPVRFYNALVAFVIGVITLLLGFHGSARAQTVEDLPAIATERCLPIFGCLRGFEGFDYVRGNVGWHAWWYMQTLNKDGQVILVTDGISCRHGVCNLSEFFAWLVDIRATGSWQEQYQAAQDKIKSLGQLDCVVEKPLCDERKAYIAESKPMAEAMFALKATPLVVPPSAPVYAVKPITCTADPTGATCTRPVYEVINGVKGTKVVDRVVVGTVCDLTWKLASGADYWALVAPGRTALCALKK